MAATDEETAHLSTDEIRAAIESFDDAMMLRLEKASRYWAVGRGITADDLLQDAVERSLTGDRRCPRSVPVHTFLSNVMRSLASASRKSDAVKLEKAVDMYEEEECSSSISKSPKPSPDELNMSADEVNKLACQLDDLFAGDEGAQLVLAGLLQEMTREEIQSECKLSDVEYETIRTRMRRKLDKRFPKGWRP